MKPEHMSDQANKEDGSHPLQSTGLSHPPPSFPLPPPPTIKTSITSNGGPNLLTSTLPPPPKIAFNKPPVSVSPKSSPSISGLPPPPKIKSLPTRSGVPSSGLDGQMKDLSLANNVHSTQEQIPILSSAPPSGVSLSSLDKVVSPVQSAPQPNNSTANYPAAVPGTTHPQQDTQSNIPAAPPSGTSWTSFTQNASGFIEKAGRLAINTVESAADLASDYLLDDEGLQQQAYQQSPQGQFQQMNQPEYQQFQQQQHVQTGQQQLQQSPQPQIEQTRRNFEQQQQLQQLDTQQFEQQAQEQAFQTFNGPSQQLNIDMSSPAIQPTKTIPNSAGFPSLPMDSMRTAATPTISKPTGKRKAYAAPPLTILAPRQSLLKVLIVPTADAQTIAAKNNTTLCDMFRIYGNAPNTDKESYRPPLPPFRSANRSMMLTWDNLTLDFISLQDMESRPVSESVAEAALGESTRMWDEDFVDHGEEELERLESCVVDVLAEEREEEKIRKLDGRPSMSSFKPKKGALPYGSDDDENTFRDVGNEALSSCADAAFALTSLPTAPWLLRFRHTLDRSTDGMSHEMLCNPSVVILAACTSENYLICFAELANVHHLPRPYHDGRYDPNGLRREFLLIHDVVNGPKNFDEAKALAQMKERFGPGCCSVLRVNSLVPETDLLSGETPVQDEEWEMSDTSSPFAVDAVSDQYKASLANVIKQPNRGICLSDTDKQAIRRFVANMVVTGLVPAVERRIANLNAAVSNAKRGVKNVIKSLWRKPKESILTNVSGYSDVQKESNNLQDPTTSSVKYRFDSIESQTRLLADTLFLVRDYEAALGIYRLVKDDYKHDKAALYYASVQEMILLCMHMLDPYKDGRFGMDVFHSIETALYSYTRAADEERESENGSGTRPGEAPYATRLATRLCLVLSSTRSLTEGKHMEIADLLASASSHETPLGAAVLLEQSSAHYYRAGMLRKYAFHMLMAGHMFRSAGQERHAFRCFAASLYVYHGERWDELRSHLSTALAAQLYGMGQFALSMQFYAKLISAGGGRVSVRSQQKFVNHLIDICRDHQSSAVVAVDRMNIDSNDDIVDRLLSGFSDAAKPIEISNLGFPCVEDSSIRVCVENTRDSCISIGRSDSTVSKDSSKGDETVWQDMMNCAEAELKASAISSATKLPEEDSGEARPTVHSGDENLDRVIMEIDKQERDAEYRERQKRKGKCGTPEVRATSEPIAVSFSLSNPLGIDIDLTEVQLVATMECKKMGLRHTNEFAISEPDFGEAKIVTFYGSEKEYRSPEFMCQVPLDVSSEDSATLVKDSDPFFVVTKLSVKVAANSDTTVSLNISPLVEGDLNVLGFRFKLLNEVWVYNRFNLLGPLLQDTQLNKSKRARGESLVLRSKVEQKMPFLKVSVEPDSNLHGTVLQGQTSHWKLKLSNLGYAPATNIMLKTNAPWLNISDSGDGKTQSEDSPTSFCVGPSGTLMQVPFKGALGHLGVLYPGETTEVPIVIRTSGGGRQDFYMLFRYELWSEQNATSNLAPLHRWTREILSIPVYPSITMSASLMPSYSTKGEHILSIELMNYRSDRDANLEIDLSNVCIASRNFKVRQLEGQVYPEQNPTLPALQIGWQERITLHYLVAPTETVSCFSALSTLSSGHHSTDYDTSSSSRHVTDFMCRERAHEVFTEMLHTHRVEKERLAAEQEKEGQPRHVAQIRRARTSLPTTDQDASSSELQTCSAAHPTSISSLCPSNDASNINIICCWSALVGDDKKVHGQHHLRNLMVRPQIKSKGCPLALTANHKSTVSHDFNARPLDLDLEVIVRNRLVEADVRFEFSLDEHPTFDFIGMSSFSWKLSGGEEINVPLKARIYSGGVYNLQCVRLTVLKGESSIPYLFPLQWTITVEEL